MSDGMVTFRSGYTGAYQHLGTSKEYCQVKRSAEWACRARQLMIW